jgi:hypothetical protein
MNWTDFTTENATGKRRNASTFAKFKQRDESACKGLQEVLFTEVNNVGPVYPTFSAVKVARPVFIPDFCRAARLELLCAATSGTGYVSGELVVTGVGTATSAPLVITSLYPSFGYQTLLWPVGSIASTFQRKSATLNLKLAHSSGSGTSYIATQATGSGIIVIGMRFSWD